MTDHVPVAARLRLDPEFRHVEAILREVDPDLRLRRSAERADFYVLERRCRRSPAVNAGLLDDSDLHIQARDGYVHVSLVHPNWLTRPENILDALASEGVDLFAKTADQVDSELAYEERWAKETRRRRRLGLMRDIAIDAPTPDSTHVHSRP